MPSVKAGAPVPSALSRQPSPLWWQLSEAAWAAGSLPAGCSGSGCAPTAPGRKRPGCEGPSAAAVAWEFASVLLNSVGDLESNSVERRPQEELLTGLVRELGLGGGAEEACVPRTLLGA